VVEAVSEVLAVAAAAAAAPAVDGNNGDCVNVRK